LQQDKRGKQTQAEKFSQAAEKLEPKDDEVEFDSIVKRLAKAGKPPLPQKKSK
jgi:hypothetical protein